MTRGTPGTASAGPVTVTRQHVVATAGHVDHGKSALVRALTGMEPDRYAEERRRGMTIDLGFVWTTLGDADGGSGERAGTTSGLAAEVAFVDVPGHERFVTTMLAGVGPVPAVLLVVAADEGWMPQSAEHLAALHALGVRHSVVAVSRSDLADPAPVMADVERRLSGTSLAGSEVVPVSSVTGTGLDVLRSALGRLLGRLPPPEPDADVRLWVDRSFTMTGAGTVVTGTLPAGGVRVGDELELHTSSGTRIVQVRGLHSLGRRRQGVTGVARVAVNLRGVPHHEIARGDCLLTAGTVTRSDLVDVRLHRLAEPGTRLPARCQVHLGSVQAAATVRPLDGDLVRLRLVRPLPLRRGDRLLLREPGRHLVLGAAVVLDLVPPPLHRRGDARRRGDRLARVPDEPRVAEELSRRGTATVALLRGLGLSRSDVDEVDALRAPGGHLVDHRLVPQLYRRLVEEVGRHREEHPLETGVPLERARQLLGLADVRVVTAVVRSASPVPPAGGAGGAESTGGAESIGGAESTGGAEPGGADGGEPGHQPDHEQGRAGGATSGAAPALVVRDGRVSLVRDDNSGLPARVAAAVEVLRTDLAARPFLAPDAVRLRELGLDRRALGAAVRAGLLARVAEDVYLGPGWVERVTARLADLPEPFGVSDVRQALDTTRRVAVPLLERLDAEQVTRRLPDDRRVLRLDG